MSLDTGTFSSLGAYTLGADPYGIATGDFDQDGIADVAAGARVGSAITVGLSRPQPDALILADALPMGADKQISLTEETSYSFSLGDFGFSDPNPGDTFGALRIDSLPSPSAGALRLGSATVASGQVIPADQIQTLRFEPALNFNGASLATFTFSVRDASLFDFTPNTVTLNVTPVNDAPTLFLSTPGFGSAGVVVTPIGTVTDYANAMALQSDGKIVAAGASVVGSQDDFALVRYQAGGGLDTSFGTGGKTVTAIGVEVDVATGVALQPDGTILVGGYSFAKTILFLSSTSDYALARYLPSGALDTSFGSGGKVRVDVGGINDFAYAMTVQPDGKILLAGHGYFSSTGTTDVALVRFNSNGSLDTTFDADGKVSTNIGGDDTSRAIALQADGKIVVAAASNYASSTADLAVVRYNANGTLDTTFDTDGRVVTAVGTGADLPAGVVIQNDGKIVVAAYSVNASGNRDFSLVRYESNGALDLGFGAAGKVLTAFGSGDDVSAALALQPDGKLVVAGYSVNSSGNKDISVARFLPNGSLDSSFDFDGKLMIAGTGDEVAKAILVQPDGRLVIAGSSGPVGAATDFHVVRLNPDGTLDASRVYVEGGAAVPLDRVARVVDPDLGSYAGATLSLARQGGPSATDQFVASGDLQSLTEGQPLVVSGVNIGQVTQNSVGQLSLQFGTSATQTLVDLALRGIAYRNTSDAPPTSVELAMSFSDGNTGAQGPGGALTSAGLTTVAISGVNDAPTGVVTVSGSMFQGQTLSAVSSLADADGLGALSFQWRADGQAISGATGPTLVLGQAQVGKAISVTASYLDGQGTTETVASANTSLVQGLNDPPTGALTMMTAATSSSTTRPLQASDRSNTTTQFFNSANNHIYEYVDMSSVSFSVAKATAESKVLAGVTGHLVTITSASEQTFVQSNNRGGLGRWIAASDASVEGQWRWVSGPESGTTFFVTGGSSTGYSNWAPNEPNNTNNEDYALMFGSSTSYPGRWNDGTAAATSLVGGYVVEYSGTVTVPGVPVDVPAIESAHFIEDRVLKANASQIADPDGLGVFTYQWQRAIDANQDGSIQEGEWTNITGASAITYALSDADVGRLVRVTVSYVDGDGKAERVASVPSLAVTGINDAPSGALTIVGTAVQNQTLTVNSSVVDSDGIGSISYQWNANAQPIAGANGTSLLLTQALVGKAITLRASYTDNQGTAESVLSGSTAPVANINDTPTGSVTVTGDARQGQTLTVSQSLADVDGMGTVSYQWLAGNAAIPGATGSSLLLTQSLVGQSIAVSASYTDALGTAESVTSASTATVANVNDAPTGTLRLVVPVSYPEIQRPLQASDVNNPFTQRFNSINNHIYEYVDAANVTFTNARAAAEAKSLAGGPGHLVTITDAVEQSFVFANNPGAKSRWMGASDAEVEGRWKWIGGPEAGTQFFGFGTPAGAYSNWAAFEPNNMNGSEPYAFFYGSSGSWNDATNTNTNGVSAIGGYVVEYSHVVTVPAQVVDVPATQPSHFREDQILKADVSQLADLDGIGAISFQWQRGVDSNLDGVLQSGEWGAISGATAATYSPSDADVGRVLRVIATYQDTFGTTESLLSSGSLAVEGVNDVPTGSVAISGEVAQGQTLSVANTIADADGLGTVAYAWRADGQPIAGATGATFSPGQQQVGKVITVSASYVDGQGTVEMLTSAATLPVANVNDPPAGSLSISGNAQQGQTLGFSGALADLDGMGDISYQWRAAGEPIAGATGSTLLLTQQFVGKAISLVASYVDGYGNAESFASAATAPVANVNDAPTGSVQVGGQPLQGQILTASNTLADVDGLGAITYRWSSGGQEISGVTGSTLTLTQSHVGKTITVTASYADGQGTAEAVSSVPTAPVGNVNDAPTGAVSIAGTATQGQVLTASNSLADLDGLGSVIYQWRADNQPIAGANSASLNLSQAHVGKAISVTASYIDALGAFEEVASAATSLVANVNDAPTGSVVVSGAALQGKTLSASHSLVDLDGMGTVSFQWMADGQAIAGAQASTLTLAQEHVGKAISVVASYTDALGSRESVASAATDPVGNINDLPTGSVTISGTVSQGQILSAANTLGDLDGVGTVSYQWRAGGQPIAQATTPTLSLSQAHVGQVITVTASYTDGFGAAESVTSAATVPVANVNDLPTGSVTINGTATQRQTLTATNTLGDVDGMGGVSYQWYAGGTAIAGATGSTLQLGQDQVGKAITVSASYVDGQGSTETATSAATAAVGNVNDPPLGAILISGIAEKGGTLTASSTLQDADGIGTIRYQWKAGSININGATSSTFTLTDAQVGKTISVVGSYTDGFGTAESVSSASTSPVWNPGTPAVTGNIFSDPVTGHVFELVTGAATWTNAAEAATQRVFKGVNGYLATITTASEQTALETFLANRGLSGSLWLGGADSVAEGVWQWETGPEKGIPFWNDASTGSAVGGMYNNWDPAASPGQAAIHPNAATEDYLSVGASASAAAAVRYKWGDAAGTGTSAYIVEYPVWTQVFGLEFEGADGSPFVFPGTQSIGTPTISTAEKASGDSSIYFPGNGSALLLTADSLNIGTRDFSIEFSYKVDDLQRDSWALVDDQQDGGWGEIALGQPGRLQFSNAGVTVGAALPADDNWHLLQARQIGGSSFLYIDGVLVANGRNTTASSAHDFVNTVLGSAGGSLLGNASASFKGWVDDFQVLVSGGSGGKPPTGSVTIIGKAQQGQTLVAVNNLADADGLGQITYQWKAGGEAIDGAVGPSLTLSQSHVGKPISVQASYTDGQGTVESVSSAATTAVINLNDAPTGTVTISGTAEQGQVLTASNTLADLDGLGTIGYQWLAGGQAIAGATGTTLTLAQAQVGKTVTVRASYTDGFGASESRDSAATTAVANVNDAPSGNVRLLSQINSAGATEPATLQKHFTEDQVLRADMSQVGDLDGMGTAGYQWQRGTDTNADGTLQSGEWANISGATTATYSMADADVGRWVRVSVSYRDGFGATETIVSPQSLQVAGVNDPPAGAVAITGQFVEDQTLTATNTLTDADGLGTITYQWSAGDEVIAGVTGASFKLAQQQVGKAIRVSASYVDGQGTRESITSSASAAVSNVNDAPTGALTITGSIAQGQQLGITSTVSDEDGLGQLAYQWRLDGQAVAGATGTTFLLTQAHVGKKISVSASYVDGFGALESVTSPVSVAVVNVNDAPTGAVTVTGSAIQGRTLSAAHNLSDIDGLGVVSYKWLADGQPIAGAQSSSLVLTQQHVGKAIAAVATYTDGQGTAESVSSAATTAVVNVNDPPTGTVSIGGNAVQGQTLTASNALADLDGLGTIGYQWLAGGQVIAGATGTTLALGQEQVGKAITVRASYTDGFGAVESKDSLATVAVTNVNDAPTGTVRLFAQKYVPETTRGLLASDITNAASQRWNATNEHIYEVVSANLTWSQANSAASSKALAGVSGHLATLSDKQELAIAESLGGVETTDAWVGLSDQQVEGQWKWASGPEAGTLLASLTVGGNTATADFAAYDYLGVTLPVRSTDFYALPATTVLPKYLVEYSGRVTVPASVITEPATLQAHFTEDQVLKADLAQLIDLDGVGTPNYQWQRGTDANADGVLQSGEWANIAGATAATYSMGDADVGRWIRVSTSYRDGFGATETVVSPQSLKIAGVNDLPTGAVTIVGQMVEDQVLTATSTLADADGLGVISYEWSAGGEVIAGESASTLKLTQQQVGKAIRVTASYVDGQGTRESAAGVATGSVSNINDAPIGELTITGGLAQGQQLSVASTVADEDGIGQLAYQWRADGQPIAGANGTTLQLTQAHVDKAISVSVSYVDAHGTAESVTSSATAAIENVNDPPVGTVALAGTARQGETLTLNVSLSDVDGLGTFSYQWTANDEVLPGQAGTSLLLTQAHTGARIAAVVSYTDMEGTLEVIAARASAVVENVNDPPTGSVTISGRAARGQTLSVSNTIADVDGLGPIAYQWFADGQPISGATSPSLVLERAQVGKSISVAASYTDVLGTPEEVRSAATSPVEKVNSDPLGDVRMLAQVAQAAVERPLRATDVTNPQTQAFNPATQHIYEIVTANLGWSEANVAAATRTIAGVKGHLATLVDYSELMFVFSLGGGYGGTGLSPEAWLGLSDTDTESTFRWAAGPEQGVVSNWEIRENSATADHVSISDSAILYARPGSQSLPKYVAEYSDPVVVSAAKPAIVASAASHFTEGQVLYVDPSLLTDADGIGPFSYQWQRKAASGDTNWTDISGATGGGYTLTNADVGRLVRVVVGYVDQQGSEESVASPPSLPIVNLNDAPSGADKAIALQEDTGLQLTAADFGFSDPDVGDQLGAVRVDELPAPAGGTLKLGTVAVLAGQIIPASQIANLRFDPATNASGSLGNVRFTVRDAELFDISPNTLSFTASAINDAPVNTVPSALTVRSNASFPLTGLSISDPDTGTQNISITLTSQQGVFSIQGFPPAVVVAGNGTATLKLTGMLSDLNQSLNSGLNYRSALNFVGNDSVSVFTTDFGYSGAGGTLTDLDSIAVTVLPPIVNRPPAGAVTISGTPRQSMPLTVGQTISDPDGIPDGAISFQWLAAEAPIAGANSVTFTPTAAQVGKSLSVIARYVDVEGTAESVVSAVTSEVAPELSISSTVEAWDSTLFRIYGRSGELPVAGFVKRGERGDIFIAKGTAQILSHASGPDGKYFEIFTNDSGSRLRLRSDADLQGKQDQRAYELGSDGRERLYSVAGDDVYVANLFFAEKGWSSPLAIVVVDTLPEVYLSGNPVEKVTLHEGTPLTGSITGSRGKDAFSGENAAGGRAAIYQASIVDLFGDSAISARASGVWEPTGIAQSTIKLGDGTHVIAVEVAGAGYTEAVSSSTIEMGAGDSTTTVKLNNGTTGDDRRMSAMLNSAFKAGAGNDRLEVSAKDATPNDNSENFVRALYQLAPSWAGGIDMGDGNDVVMISALNVDARSSTAAESSLVALGSGNDVFTAESSLIGLERTTIEGGAGNDRITVDAFLAGAKGSQIVAGDGDDIVIFEGGGEYSVSLDGSEISLGAGDDRLELERGSGSIDGGLGDDTVKLVGQSTNFLVSQGSAGKVTVKNVLDGRTDLTVTNVERFEFTDKTLTAAEALSALGQTKLPPADTSSRTHEGSPLTGYIAGSTGNDTYLGGGRAGVTAAITRATITDPLGANSVRAEIRSGWSPSGIELSTIRFGDGVSSIDVEAIGSGSLSGISSTVVEFGAGAGRISVSIGTGTTSDGRNMRAIDGSTIRMGAGVDVLEVLASDDSINDSIENYVRGISDSGVVDLGDGNDTARIAVVNAGSRAATAIERSGLLLGSGDDRLEVSSSLTGIEAATVDGGAGNDTLIIAAEQVALKGGELLLGAGNDVVMLVPGGERSVSLDLGSINLGTGDDRLEIDRGNGTLEGGFGIDTLAISGTSSVYRINQSAPGVITIRDVTDGRTDLRVSGFETLQFLDRSMTVSQALSELGQTPLPSLTATNREHRGEPLTGYINGSSGHDQYIGRNSSVGLTAISRAYVTDSLGDSTVSAVTRGGWSASGIEASTIRLGDGTQRVAVEVVSNGSTVGVFNTQLDFGAGDSTIDVSVDTGTTSDNRSMRGLDGVTLRLGAGRDALSVKVSDGTLNDGGENFVRGLNAVTADFGEGDDRIDVSVSNAGERAAVGIEGGTITLGAGNDQIALQSTRQGLVRATVDTGEGNDSLSVAARTGLVESTISLGAGNDVVTLTTVGGDGAGLETSSVDLGAGDDQMTLTRGTGTIEGGAGVDVLKVQADSLLYVIDQAGVDRHTMRSVGTTHTMLSLANIERVEFADKVVVLKEVVAPTPTYAVSASQASVNEGATITFNLVTTNVAADTTVPFTISGTGITAADLKGQALSGAFTVSSLGRASVTLSVSDDLFTEGAEILTLTAAGKSATATIQDTSTTPVTVAAVNFSNVSGLRTSESGQTASFGVVLSKAPRYDVTVTLTSSDPTEGVFAGNGQASQVLTFTPSNWNQTQTVTVKGLDDSETDGDLAFNVTTATKSSDFDYDGMRSGQGLQIATVVITNTDDDIPDQQLGTNTVDYLQGGPGPSDMYGFLGRDELKGGRGDDRLYGGYDDDRLIGEEGNDSLEGEQGNDTLFGNDGDDNLLGGTGRDTLYGGEGNDVLDGDKDADFMDGGNGSDTYYVDNPGDVFEDSGTDKARDIAYVAAYLSKPLVLGGGIDDAELSEQAGNTGVTGNEADNVLKGNSGNNVLDGGAGADDLGGGAGSDNLSGGAGNDELRGGEGSDTLNGGEGEDCAEYEDQMIGIFASLIEAVARGKGSEEGMWTDRLLQIENVCGSQGDDQIKGDVGTNKIGGNAGNDTLVGGAGFDWLEPEAALNGLRVDLLLGKVLDDGFGGTDTVSGIEGVIGSTHADVITGDARANRFWGHGGNDTIDGGVGADEAFYEGGKSNYRVDALGSGKVKVTDLRVGSPEGADELTNIETLVFSDGVLEVAGANAGYATVTPGAAAGGGKLSGVVYHWKSHVLLDGVEFAGTPGAASGGSGSSAGGTGTGSSGAGGTAPLVQLFELKSVQAAAPGKLSAELWVNPKMASGSVDVRLTFDPSFSVAFTNGGKLPAGWTVLDSTKSGQWTLAGMGLSSFNAPVSLGVLEWTKGSAGIQSLDVRFVDAATEGESQRPYVTTLVPGLSGSGDAGSPTDTSGTTGRYTLAGLATGQNALVAAKSIGEAESGSVVSAADAIAALRLSLGMSPNPDPDGTGPLAPLPASPYQLIAADANEDGRVSAADALAVLKMAARRGDAPEREWLFVREDEDFWDHTANGGAGAWMINRNSVLYDRADKALNVSDKGATVNLVGVLKGDVNGNWAPEGTDAQTLPSTYFLGLAAELNTPIGQWGIGG